LDAPRGSFPSKVRTQKALGRKFKIVQENNYCFGYCCADGSALDLALIFQGTSGIQSSWVREVEAGEHPIFVANSASGWTNDDLGLAWLEQVFYRKTRKKAGRK
jgi:hypothetical protein